MSATNTDHSQKTGQPHPAVLALAIVGFVALVILGILLAIYSSRYIPEAISNLIPSGHLTTIPTPGQFSANSSTTLSFGGEATTSDTYPQSKQVSYGVTPIATNAVPASGSTYTSHPAAPYGLPNLKVTIIATGYLANGTTESFVPAQVIPVGARAAIQFSVANTGTNVAGPWNFVAEIPTHNGYAFTSPIEQPLNPGDHIVFTLGFDQADWGPNHPITVLADPSNAIPESNEGDNSASAVITVQ